MTVVGGIDNVLYPILVGNRLKLHTVLAFIAVVGGLILFGPSGLILGPVVLTITQLLLEIWRSRIAPDAIAHIEPNEISKFENDDCPQTCELPVERFALCGSVHRRAKCKDTRLTTK